MTGAETRGAATTGAGGGVGTVTAGDTGWAGTCATGVEITAADTPAAPINPRRAPTATVVSTATSMARRVPATGDGISVSTLSVETSRSASSTAIESPTFFSQRVTVPSETLSPSAGIVMTVPALVATGEAGAAGAGGGVTGAGVSTTASGVAGWAGTCAT